MTTFYSSSLTSTGPIGQIYGADRHSVVLEGVILAATSGPVFDQGFLSVGATDGSLLVMGTLIADGTVIECLRPLALTIAATGSVQSVSQENAAAIEMKGVLVNHGAILAAGNNFGVGILGEADSVAAGMINTGTITAGQIGVFIVGLGVTVANSGTISATLPGVGSVGLQYVNASGAHLANSGLIETSGSADSAALDIIGDSSVTVMNEGTIRSTTGFGIRVSDSSSLYLTNLGVISGNANFRPAIQTNNGSDVVKNTGTIVGSVDLGGGSDVFDTIGGIVTGPVLGGAGNDLYRIGSASVVIIEEAAQGNDTIEAAVSYDLGATPDVEVLALVEDAREGAGNLLANVLLGNSVGNRLSGLGGNDTLLGQRGNDTLDGGQGSDSIAGDDGEDDLRGRGGNDTLTGGEGDDRLAASWGTDSLSGGDGEDTLIGGIGRDTLTGGSDADTFVFRRIGESGTTTGTRDVIQDFTAGDDVIDLSAIDANANSSGNQTFTWIGTGAFTNVAGQLRFDAANGDLLADVTGDGTADFAVRLTGVTAMAAGDILL